MIKFFIYTHLLFASFIPLLSAHTTGEVICSGEQCYTIVETLGAGAFGQVFKVEDRRGKPLALKVYHQPSNPSDLNGAPYEDVAREYERGQQLSHPHIVKSIDYFTEPADGDKINSYLFLQFIKGNTLWRTMSGDLTIQQAASAALDFTKAAHHAASRKLLHLDLHEGNVMVDDKKEIMVIDLASFFTVEEIIGFIADTNSTVKHKALGEKMAANMPIRQKKLEQFFEERPELLEQLQKTSTEPQEASDTPIHKGIAAKGIPSVEQTNSLYQYYFFSVVGMTYDILDKATIPQKKRAHLDRMVKQLEESIQHKVDQRQPVSLPAYLLKLEEAIWRAMR
jgi:hypothetical protein